MLSEWSPIVLQLSVLMAVGGILGIIAWIGYVMATTKPTSATITSLMIHLLSNFNIYNCLIISWTYSSYNF